MTIDQMVSEHNRRDFSAAFELAYQQLESVLKDCVDYKDCSGSEASVGIHLFDKKTNQNTRKGRVPANLDNRTHRRKRWLLYRDPIHDGEYIDEMDIWKQAFDPESELTRTAAANIARQRDERIILDGMFGDAYEGKEGPMTTNAFPAANVIAATVKDEDDATGGNKGMNIKKMRTARLKMYQSEVAHMFPNEKPKFGWNAKQHDDMLQYLRVVSHDFNRQEAPVLVSGRIKEFMGFELIECERWPLKAGTTDIRLNCAWFKHAIKRGTWSDVRPRMWNDGHRNNTPIINIDLVEDVRRMRDEAVIQIESLEA